MKRDVFRTLKEDENGAVAATYALALVGLIAVAGVGFDYARLSTMDSELQNGADQAALAGASQLDGEVGACARAAAAAKNLVSNATLLASDSRTVSIPDASDCNGVSDPTTGSIKFWKDAEATEAATSDVDAHFIQVDVAVRTVDYALTPVTGLLTGSLAASALAGLGSSVCKVPPIMICSPDPTQPFNSASKKGIGVVATGHNAGKSTGKSGDAGSDSNNTWAPGDFGFLQVNDPNDSSNRNAQLLKALAYANPPIDCAPIDGNKVSPGNPQGLYDAINTRFDIYDFPSNGGKNALASCQGSNCPPSSNVVKDLINSNPSANNGCKFANGNGGGWKFPDIGKEFKPVSKTGSTNSTLFDDNGIIDAMGLPRDNCHYTSYNGSGLCSGGGTGRFGDGTWDRADYFKVNHTLGGVVDYPPSWQNITRYQTYLWEIDNNKIPNGSGSTSQRGRPICYGGTLSPEKNRRVITVAVVSNCSELHGGSETVDIDEWVDVFLVEPSSDDNIRYNAFKDAIYVEVIGPSKVAGNGTYASQAIRRDVPYLVR